MSRATEHYFDYKFIYVKIESVSNSVSKVFNPCIVFDFWIIKNKE